VCSGENAARPLAVSQTGALIGARCGLRNRKRPAGGHASGGWVGELESRIPGQLRTAGDQTLYVNKRLLPPPLRPGWFATAGLVLAGSFFTLLALVTAAATIYARRSG
jgi:hypothetical protein